MRGSKSFVVGLVAILGLLGGWAAPARAADAYEIDPVHSSFGFKASHLGISWIHGRFNEVSGKFQIDKDAAKCSFEVTIKVESIDTGVKKRDDHLRGSDFFDVKQHPTITFKSKSVKAIDGGYELTGDFTMHGVTKSITFALKGGKVAEFPKGTQRIGFSTDLTLKRSDYGMDKLIGAAGDEVSISISMEGIKKQ